MIYVKKQLISQYFLPMEKCRKYAVLAIFNKVFFKIHKIQHKTNLSFFGSSPVFSIFHLLFFCFQLE